MGPEPALCDMWQCPIGIVGMIALALSIVAHIIRKK